MVTAVGDADGDGDAVTLSMFGRSAVLPINLPSEARQVGPHLGRRVVVALLEGHHDGKTAEERIAWLQCEVDRLRDLLAAFPIEDAAGRFEAGRATVVCTLRSEDAERRAVAQMAELLASEDTKRRIAAAETEKRAAEETARHLAMMVQAALPIIDAIASAMDRGDLALQAGEHGMEAWEKLRAFVSNAHVRDWLKAKSLEAVELTCERGEGGA